jgi:TubC N-terminal docking domain
MTLDELITEMRDKDIRIFDDGNAFKLHAPKGILTPQLLEVITAYQGELLYLVRLGDVRVCPARWEHRPQWRYSQLAHKFVCRACRGEEAA